MSTAIRNKFSEDDIVALLGVMPYDELDELNWMYGEERALYNYAFERDLEFDSNHWKLTSRSGVVIDIESVRLESSVYEKCYGEVIGDLYHAWRCALETTMLRVLEIVDLYHKRTEDGYYIIAPCRNWRYSLNKILEVRPGYYYDNITQYKRDYGSTDQQACLRAFDELDWMESHSQIKRWFSDYLQHEMRNW